MTALIAAIVATAAAIFGYRQARYFVFNRLAYVDGIHRRFVPLLAGAAAGALALPLVGLLPWVGGGTALLFGISVGMGVAAGARSVRKRLTGWA